VNNEHPIAWRFEDIDCRLSDIQKESIVFLNENFSGKIWHDFISDKGHLFLMDGSADIYKNRQDSLDTSNKDFFCVQESLRKFIFSSSFVFALWGAKCGILCEKDIFLDAWDDFFYPGDENTVIICFPGKQCIYSFEEMLFFSKITYLKASQV
jgi:hypothetical protein